MRRNKIIYTFLICLMASTSASAWLYSGEGHGIFDPRVDCGNPNPYMPYPSECYEFKNSNFIGIDNKIKNDSKKNNKNQKTNKRKMK